MEKKEELLNEQVAIFKSVYLKGYEDGVEEVLKNISGKMKEIVKQDSPNIVAALSVGDK